MTTDSNTLPATADDLTEQQHRFVASFMQHGVATRAYREAYANAPGRSQNAVCIDAHRLLKSPAVAARVAELRAIAAEALNTSVAELAMQAHEVARASVSDIQPIEVYGCRHCWGVGNRYQWRDYEELADALVAWHASLETKPTPKPDERGGVGYSSRADVNPECEHCRGHGVAVPRIVPTSELSPGARLLYEGATVSPDGTVRVMVADRSKWAHQRNQLLGAYAPQKVEGRHAHLHVHRQAPDTRVPMSAEEAVALLEQTP